MAVSRVLPKFSKKSRSYGWERQQERMFYLFISPWLFGFLVFTLGPMIASAGISLTSWDLLMPPKWVGLSNFRTMLFNDPLFWHSLRITVIYSLGSVVLNIILAMIVAG